MTDKNDEQPGFDKEIEEMDQFLEKQDRDFPIDDDQDEVYGKPQFEQSKSEAKKFKRKGKFGLGKFIVYLIFLGLIGGIGYAGVVYAPQLIEDKQIQDIKGYIQKGGQDLIGTVTDKTRELIEDNTSASSTRTSQASGTLPRPSDDTTPLAMSQTEEVQIPSPTPDAQAPAETIADALAITQQTPEVIFPEEPTETDEQSPSDESLTDQIPSPPIVDGANTEDIIVEEDIATVPEKDPVAVVQDAIDALNNVSTDQEEQPLQGEDDMLTEAEDVSVATPSPPMMEEDNMFENTVDASATDSTQAKPTEEKVVAVEEKVAKPVTQSANIPAPRQPPKRVKPEDPRVLEARTAFENDNFQQALTLYQAILTDDPSNTAALTGRQLAQAKLRMQQQDSTPQKSAAIPPSLPASTPPVVSPSSQVVPPQDIAILLQQAQQNPNNAQMAVNVADAYKAIGDKTNATEWYRKALQIDVVHSSGIDRMAIYDSMAEIQ